MARSAVIDARFVTVSYLVEFYSRVDFEAVMTNYNWKNLLKELSHKLIEGREAHYKWELTSEMLASRYLGNPGASEDQIVLAETR